MTPKQYAEKQGATVYNKDGQTVVTLKKKRQTQDFNKFNENVVAVAKRIKKAFEEDGNYVEREDHTTRRFSYPDPKTIRIRLKFEKKGV